MADGYWRYAGEGRQAAMAPPAGKRSRSDFDGPGVHELPGYFPREESGGPRVVRDTQSIGASYDQYLRSSGSGQMMSHGPGDSGRPVTAGAGISGYPSDGPRLMGGGVMDPGMGGVGRNMGYGGGRQEPPLPPDATNTLFVEGLPANCTRREVAHIFRPFTGYKEVRLVTKESRHPGGVPLVLCFVDFSNASHAAVALDVLQGYKFDENDRDTAVLRLQFARFPGPRSAGGRGKR